MDLDVDRRLSAVPPTRAQLRPWARRALPPRAEGPIMTLLQHVPAPHRDSVRPAPRLHVGTLDLPADAREHEPQSQSQLDAAAREADVVRLRHTAAVPSDGALARVIALLEEGLAEAGRARSSVRVALELQVAVVRDDAAIARKRRELGHLDALAGLSWSPSTTWVVTTSERLVDDVLAAAAPLDVDDVVLRPLGGRAQLAVR